MTGQTMQPRIFHALPEGFLDARAQDMEALLGGPALIHIAGKESRPLFVSTLLHGNEHSSIIAMQELIGAYHASGEALPRSILMLVGNVAAARQNCRFMPGQVDYNRIWAGGGDAPEFALARFVLDYVREQRPVACIDIHNNTGASPSYGCVNRLDKETLALAALFNQALVYFTEPHEVLSAACGEFAPSITVECGLSAERSGIDHAVALLEAALRVEDFSALPFDAGKLDIYEMVVRLKLPENALFDFGGDNSQLDFRFIEGLEELNFAAQPEGTMLGCRFNDALQLVALDDDGQNVTEEFLYYHGQEICMKREAIPAMFTRDKQAVVSDCLGYFMLRCALPSPLPEHGRGMAAPLPRPLEKTA